MTMGSAVRVPPGLLRRGARRARRRLRLWIAGACVSLLGAGGIRAATLQAMQQAPAAGVPASATTAPDFSRDVLPILESNCLRCHSAAAQKGGLILDTHEDLLQGGRHGAALVAGDAKASPMIGMMEGTREPRMPPKEAQTGGTLRPEDIATIRAWIDAGAKDSPGAQLTLDSRLPRIAPNATFLPAVNSLAWRPDGRELVVPGYREVRGFGASASRPLSTTVDSTRTLTGAIDLVRGVAYSADGWWIAGAGGIPGVFGEVLIWDADTGKLAHTLKGHRDYVYEAVFNHRSTRVATASYDRTARIWDLDTGRAFRVLREHTEAVFAVAFSPDDRWVATGAGDRSVKVWDVRSGRRLYTLTEPTDAVSTVHFHPSGKRLSAAGADKTIRTWDVNLQGGAQAHAVLAHTAPILRIAYSRHGKLLASSAADGLIKIWDTARWKEVRTLDRQPDWAQGLSWSPDDTRLAVGRYDGSVTVYDVRTGRRILHVIQPDSGSETTRKAERE
jgi:WD40 repeat protein